MFATRLMQLFILSAAVLAVMAFVTSTDEQAKGTHSDTFAITDFLRGNDAQDFAQVTGAREFRFPADYGSHNAYRSEWWYFTGNNEDASGRQFGYQLTFFRFSPTAQTESGQSRWRNNQFYMAHFAVTDVKEKRFYTFERYSRAAAGLAGANSNGLRVWLDDWSATAESGIGFPLRIQATEEQIAIELTLQQGKPVVLHGDNGVSIKNSEPGNASYYYSYTRMPTEGTISIDGNTYKVTGNSWMDREWSSSALGSEQLGWDWFALQLSNNHELMYYRFRRLDDVPDRFSYGALILPDGQVRTINYDMVGLDVKRHWLSQRSRVTYPVEWRLRIPAHDLDLHVRPAVTDQELALSFHYWEGTVDVQGTHDGNDIVGRGYVELTGYGEK